MSPELLNSRADNFHGRVSLLEETGKAGTAAVWINDVVCTVAPFGIQTKMAAELKGIETALEHCICNPSAREKINIFTDSLSALHALQKLPPADNIQIINQIIIHIQALKHHDIHFHWIPSHAGIYYNDFADGVAGLAKHQRGPATIQVSRSCTRGDINKMKGFTILVT